MAFARSRRRHELDIWPGFVDALATLLIIIIFTLMVFVIAQFYLADALTGRDRALEKLNFEIARLGELLAMEQTEGDRLRKSLSEISVELQSTLGDRLRLGATIKTLTGDLREIEAKARGLEAETRVLRRRAAAEAMALRGELAAAETLAGEKDLVLGKARAAIELLNRQIAALREQLSAIQAALDTEESKREVQKIEISKLSKRLNIALAAKVQKLKKYRSEFFGRLREVLGKRSDIRIVGDRFVFQSEVLFTSSSAGLQPGGKAEIAKLAGTLKEIAAQIPAGINWILRVDGHTDERPIHTPAFDSNWELSTARAVSVVKFLIEQGIPASRLAATGFGEFQPIDTGKSPAAFRKNRRIELKFDQR